MMEVKVSSWCLPIFLALLGFTVAQGASQKEEIVNKYVHVHVPKRKPTTIDHFTPAEHTYKAEGNVLIERLLEVKKPPEAKSFTKNLQVNSPVFQKSESHHFDPSTHIYHATGDLILNEDSPLLDDHQNLLIKATHPTNLHKVKADFGASKFASPKKPKQQFSVINHFNPIGHAFGFQKPRNVHKSNFKQFNRHKNPTNFIKNEIFEEAFIPQESNIHAQGVSIAKSVSINTPENKVSAINHFNPAGHTYQATGSVKINRNIQAPESLHTFNPNTDKSHFQNKVHNSLNSDHQNFGNRAIFVRKPLQVKEETNAHNLHKSKTHFNTKPSLEISKPIFTSNTNSNDKFVNNVKHSGQNGLHIKKSVSVKSPQQKSSVISFFSPAGHNYAATGNVVIDRNSETDFVGATSFQQQSTAAVSHGSLSLPKRTRLSHTSKTTFGHHEENKLHHVDSHSQKLHSVHVNKPSPRVTIRKKVLSETPKKSINTEFSSEIQRKKFSAPKQQVEIGIHQAKSNKFSNNPKHSGHDGLHVKKSVSVKSPQHKSSVISFFTPAGHNYAATGNVVIDRDSESDFIGSTSLQQQSTASFSKGTQSFPERTIVSQTRGSSFNHNDVNKLHHDESHSKIVHSAHISNPSPRITIRKKVVSQTPKKSINTVFSSGIQRDEFSAPKQPSNLEVHKTVNVHSPVTHSNVIDHFNPAGHRYAATGNVDIIRGSNTQSTQNKVNPVFISQGTRRNNVIKISQDLENVERKIIPSIQQKPVSTFSHSTSSHTHKSVNVKSPQTNSRTINHFSPAGHVYAAEGGVDIVKNTKLDSFLSQKPLTINRQSIVKPKSPISTNSFTSVNSPKKPFITLKKETVPSSQNAVSKLTSFVIPAETPANSKQNTVKVTKFTAPVIKTQTSNLHLEKTVSVKSPEHKSSVISHFTPAGHRYAATGNVVIDRNANIKRPAIISSVELKPVQRVSQVRIPVSNVKISSNPRLKIKQTPSVQRIKPVVQTKISQFPTRFEIPKKPIVKAQREYEVEENEDDDDDDSDEEEEKENQSTAAPAFDFGPAASYDFENEFAGINSYLPPEQSGPELKTPARKTVTLARLPEAPKLNINSFIVPKLPERKVVTVSRQPVTSKKSSGLNLKKVVSVNTPDFKPSVIDHFNPARHVYKATGEVEISRNSS